VPEMQKPKMDLVMQKLKRAAKGRERQDSLKSVLVERYELWIGVYVRQSG
jgi:hypothetical protein